MAETSLPNEILHIIFLQLDPVRFILRKLPKLNHYWNNRAIISLR